MKLVVKNNNGEKFTLQIRPNETFLDLKRRVELESGISLDLRDITSNKRNIHEQQKVIDYFLSEQNQVTNIQSPEVVCAVPTCDNRKTERPDKTYFEFPDEDIRCHQWVLYCRRIAARISSDSPRASLPVNVGGPGTAICSDHFKSEQFVKNTTTLLKRTAVPCVNPELPSATPTLTTTRKVPKPQEPARASSGGRAHNILQDSLILPITDNAGQPSVPLVSPWYLSSPFGTSATKLTCRLCALPSRNTVFIYSKEGKTMMLAEKISASLPIQIKMTDNLPKQVCRPCIEKLNSAFYLVEICTASDDNFKKADEAKRKESSERKSHGVCPCCHEGTLNAVDGHNVENDVTTLNDLCPQDNDDVVVQQQAGNDVVDRVAEADGDEIVQQLGSDQGDYILDDMLDLDGSVNGDEQFLCQRFLCRICGAGLRSYGSAEDHALSHGSEDFFQCILCTNYYSSPQELVDHFVSHKPALTIEDPLRDDPGVFCEKCGENFSSLLAIPEHKCRLEEDEGDDEEKSMSKKCALCPRAFASDHRLQFHMKFHTGILKGDCTLCDRSCASEWKLYQHMVEVHGDISNDEQDSEANVCYECGKCLPSATALKHHMKCHTRADGSTKPYSCEWCGKSFIRRSMLRNHVTTAHRSSRESSCFTCKICKEAFPTTNHAVSHMDSAHNHYVENEPAYSFEMITVSRLFQCEYCEKVFAEGPVLNKHREFNHSSTSASGSDFVCKFCSASFTVYGDLQEHKTRVHTKHDIPDEYKGEKPGVPINFLCEFCERVFVNYLKYTEHLTIHFGAEPYLCRICGSRYTTLDEVTLHRPIHGDVEPMDDIDLSRPFDCHYCEKSFAIEDALIKHIRMHTGEKPFTCDVCGKGFSQSSGLNTHKKVHSDIRPFACHLCPRTFKIKGDRDVHIRKHSGQRPFKCEFCLKAFMTQHVYSQHRKIHTGERPYRCDVCHVAFRRSHVLTVHKRIHTGEKPNICDICGKRYRQKGDMLKHRRSAHGFPKRDQQAPTVHIPQSSDIVDIGGVVEIVQPQHFLAI